MFFLNLQRDTLQRNRDKTRMEMILKEGSWKNMLNMEINKRWIELGFTKLYAIWLREFKVFLREKSRLIASTFTPVFFGSYIIWDRKFDFLKSVMVAPVSRTTIFLGKTFGGMTTSLIQAAILLVVGFVIGIHYTPLALVFIIIIILLLSFTLTSLGLTLGSHMESLEGFQLIVSFVVFPLYFLSGALFPLDNLPTWLTILTTLDPVTYGVDALREVMLGITGINSFALNISILLLSAASLGTVGVLSFRRMKAV